MNDKIERIYENEPPVMECINELPLEGDGKSHESNESLRRRRIKASAFAAASPNQQAVVMAASLPAEIYDPKEYPDAPFTYNNNTGESVSLNSGGLEYTHTDFVLPGRNGFDLNITRRYSSFQANTEDYDAGFQVIDGYRYRVKVLIKFTGISLISFTETGPSMPYELAYKAGQESLDFWDFYEAGDECWSEYIEEDFGIEISGTPRFIKCTMSQNELLDPIKSGTVEVFKTGKRDNSHWHKTFGLGYGWSLALPSIEIVPETERKNRVVYKNFVHLEDGRSYEFSGNVLYINKSKNEKYNLQDVTIQTFSTAQTLSYTLPVGGSVTYDVQLGYKDGRKDYFQAVKSGSKVIEYKLVARQDRFGNTIRFTFTDNGGLTIVDSLGQTVKLVKSGNTLTWTLPDGKNIVYTVSNETLTSVKDQLNRITAYTYTNQTADSCYFGYDYEDPGYTFTYKNLTKIVHPTSAETHFAYSTIRFNTQNQSDAYRKCYVLTSRKDRENGVDKNSIAYSFSVDSTQKYIVTSTVTRPNQVVSTHTFNDKGVQTKCVVKHSGNTVTDSTYTYNGDKQLTHESTIAYQGGKSITRVNKYTYDSRNNVLTATDPLNNVTAMTYDTDESACYSLLKSKSYKKDANTEIQEVYTLSSDKKVVEWKKVFEKTGAAVAVLREVTQYQYDSANNLVNERQYANLSLSISAEDRVTVYSYANTNSALSSAHYNGVFCTQVKIAGVKDVENGNAPSAKGAGVSQTDYIYDHFGRVIEQSDPAGNITRTAYDALGRVTLVVNPDNSQKITQYNDNANTITVIDENGAEKRYNYTPLGKIERVYALAPDTCLSYYTYDTLNRLSYEYTYGTDGTTYSVYSYDAFDRIKTKTTTGLNMTAYEEKYDYDDAFDVAQKYTKETKEIVGSGSAPSILSSVLKDVLGRAVEETVGNSTVVNKYDFVGNKTSQTDPRTGAISVEWTYDYAGRAKTETRHTDTGTITADTEYDALGNKKAFIDFRRKQTVYSYDVLGRLLEQKTDFSGSDKAVTRYYYDAVGNITNQKVLSAGGVYRETQYTYDNRYRLIDTIINDGKTETRSRFEYDAAGNKTAMYTGMLGASTSGAAKTTYTYDRFGNMKTMTDPVGNSPNPSDPAKRTETYTYDNYGQLRQKKDRNGFVTTYSYDGLGRVLRESVVDSDGEVPNNYRTFSYHKNGSKAAEENVELSVSFSYDNMGRLSSQSESCRQGAANTVVKTYNYDQCGNRKSFIMSKDGVQQISLTYDYDKQNRLKEVLRTGVKIAAYTYDANGNRASLTYPQNGIVVSYVYNDANLVTDLYNKKDGAHRSSYHYAYFLDGNQSRKTAKLSGKPDQLTDYQYDRLGRLTEEKEHGGSKIQYSYDCFSNRLKMTVTDSNNKVTTTDYEYDLRNRLQTETKTYDGTEEILHYRYDFNGNQIYREWEKFSPKKAKKTPGRVGFTSDKFKEDVVILEMREYNGFNQLTYLYRDAYETRYTYRPDGLRLKKHFADGTTLSHIWDGANIIAEHGANGSITARYLRGVNLIARDHDNLLQYYLFNALALNAETPQNEIMVSTGQGATAQQVGTESLEYFIFNAHGDVTALTNANGQIVKTYDYDAFGNQRELDPKDTNPFRYCAEYWDSDTKTLYLRNRHYDPAIGRFGAEDPINDGINWYTYCGNNPVMFVDPLGLRYDVDGTGKVTVLPSKPYLPPKPTVNKPQNKVPNGVNKAAARDAEISTAKVATPGTTASKSSSSSSGGFIQSAASKVGQFAQNVASAAKNSVSVEVEIGAGLGGSFTRGGVGATGEIASKRTIAWSAENGVENTYHTNFELSAGSKNFQVGGGVDVIISYDPPTRVDKWSVGTQLPKNTTLGRTDGDWELSWGGSSYFGPGYGGNVTFNISEFGRRMGW